MELQTICKAVNVTQFGRNVSQNIKDAKINVFITEVEQRYIKPVISDAMYLDIINDGDATKFNILVNGGTYERDGKKYFINGLIKAIVYYVQAEMLRGINVHITNSGAVEKSNEWSDMASYKSISEQYSNMCSVAEGYIRECVTYAEKDAEFEKYFIKPVQTSRRSVRIIGE